MTYIQIQAVTRSRADQRKRRWLYLGILTLVTSLCVVYFAQPAHAPPCLLSGEEAACTCRQCCATLRCLKAATSPLLSLDIHLALHVKVTTYGPRLVQAATNLSGSSRRRPTWARSAGRRFELRVHLDKNVVGG